VPRTSVPLLLGLALVTVHSAPGIAGLLWAPVHAGWVGLLDANAVVFWLFASELADDRFEVKRAHVGVWAAMATLSALQCGVLTRTDSAAATVVGAVVRWVPVLFAGLAVQAAARSWRDDLVDARRRARLYVVFGGGVYAVFLAVVRDPSQGPLSARLALLEVMAVLALVGSVAWQWLQLAPPPASAVAPVAPPPFVPSNDDEPLAKALLHEMQVECAYRLENLSIGSLASRLGVPEHRLRRLINQHLGHRNFSAFVNGFRLADAKHALADPRQAEVSILTIALDAGFQSIGPFNRAFKAEVGLTPTEYRKAKLSQPAEREASAAT
jgi:AraC-like DNA-binding protein